MDLTQLPQDRSLTIDEDGIGGEDSREKVTSEYGRWLAERIVQRLAEQVLKACQWKEEKGQ